MGAAHSGVIHSRAGLKLFPTWRPAKRISGWGHDLSPTEREENAGSREFSSFYLELEWSAAVVVVHIGGKM